MESIAVVINAGAGQGHGRELADKVTEAFARVGLAAQVSLAADGRELAASVRAALSRGERRVVAGGGDGTINQVAGVLHDSQAQAVLGVLPLGTLNHFAKDLGLPLELVDACAVIAQGRVAEVDAAEVNGRLFLNHSSIGLYPDIVHERERQQARLGRGKWPAFAWATLAALRRFPFHTVSLRVDGEELVRRTAFVFVGNNDYGMEGVEIGARPCLDQGCLCVYVAQHAGRWGLLKFALAALFGRLQQARGLEHLRTPELRIDTHRARMRVSTDGEVTELDTPLRYRSLPRSLRVFVPEAPS
jgi:YegS/Rv2252/BmrU family lipid kinase